MCATMGIRRHPDSHNTSGGSSLLNRIAPGVLAICFAAAVPPGTATPAPAPPVAPSAVKTVNDVQRPRLGAAIDVAKAVEAGVSPDVLELALNATSCATTSGAIDAPPTLTLIDYSRPSSEPRLWVFDLATGRPSLQGARGARQKYRRQPRHKVFEQHGQPSDEPRPLRHR